MSLANDIGKRGFQRWYERQLIESHVYLVTCVLGILAFLACVEALDFRHGLLRAIPMLFSAFVSGAIAWFSLMRYSSLMVRAWRLAAAATCASCKTYGRLRVVGGSRQTTPGYDASGAVGPGDPEADWVRVQCKRCGNEWTL